LDEEEGIGLWLWKKSNGRSTVEKLIKSITAKLNPNVFLNAFIIVLRTNLQKNKKI